MDSALYTAASGMIARQRELEVTANNLANASVPGFRPEMTFQEIWRRVAGARSLEGAINAQVQIPRTYLSSTPGTILDTGAPLDLALEGDAWLVVSTRTGERYMRGGSLRREADGTLVTAGGAPVLGPSGPITLPRGRVEIGADGTIRVDDQEVASLRLERVAPADLFKEGAGLHRLRPGAPVTPAGAEDRVRQGSLETSAVRPVEELMRLVGAQRAFEQHARSVHLILNEINRRAVNDIAQP